MLLRNNSFVHAIGIVANAVANAVVDMYDFIFNV